MMHSFWRLSEAGPDNLGLACTDDGLVLGRTPLIERRGGRFVVRERNEIERLLKEVFPCRSAVDRLMPGLTTVASALNANDPCLARIAAVHLKIPDLPSFSARADMEIEDCFIKSVDWNPDLHPRTGTPPNPGWFAPTGGSDSEPSPIQTAQNDNPAVGSDAPSIGGDGRARLPPGNRIDELGDFLEWLANATPDDEKAIRAEIKRYYYDVGDTIGGDALNAALSDVLEPGITLKDRQDILNGIAPYAASDPAEIAQARNLAVGAILLLQNLPAATAAIEAPSQIWKLGWAARGAYISEQLGADLPPNFPVVDGWAGGVVTSIKSIDLNAATYQDAMRLTYRLNSYTDSLALFEGNDFAGVLIRSSDIDRRVLNVAIPKGAMSAAQQAAIQAAAFRAQAFGVDLVLTPF
jgi:hypothetical protein